MPVSSSRRRSQVRRGHVRCSTSQRDPLEHLGRVLARAFDSEGITRRVLERLMSNGGCLRYARCRHALGNRSIVLRVRASVAQSGRCQDLGRRVNQVVAAPYKSSTYLGATASRMEICQISLGRCAVGVEEDRTCEGRTRVEATVRIDTFWYCMLAKLVPATSSKGT